MSIFKRWAHWILRDEPMKGRLIVKVKEGELLNCSFEWMQKRAILFHKKKYLLIEPIGPCGPVDHQTFLEIWYQE